MKKNIFLIFMFLLIPIEVLATNDINIECNKTKLKINEETTCNLNISNLNFAITDVTGNVKLGNNLQLINSTYNKNTWLSLDNNFSVTDINLMRHNNEKISNITIATFKIKADANATGNSNISFNNIELGNTEYQSISVNCNPLKINFGNNVNTLETLNIKGVNLNFTKDKTNYSIESELDSITIDATATDKNAKITGIGTKKISYGKNTFDVVVTAENGSAKIYKINVNRKDKRSNNNNLTSIILSQGKINFDKNITEYTVNVTNKIDKINISYELEDKKSTAEFIGDKNLVEGDNIFVIKVTAENKEVKEYKINIIRETKNETSENLKKINIKIKNHEFIFDKSIYEYTINTNYEKLDFEIILEDEESKYEIIGNENLKNNDTILIKVIDKDLNTTTYKFIIQNQDKKTKNNSNNIWLIIILCISILYNIILTTIYIKKNK